MGLELNDIIELADGRIGTICYRHLDGEGGVWGIHSFDMPEGGFGDLPRPEFMLREKEVKSLLGRWGHRSDIECVGNIYTRRERLPDLPDKEN